MIPSPPTGNKPLTSPKTNLVITIPALAMLFPNVLASGMVLDFKAAATCKWEEQERRWQEWAEKQQGQQGWGGVGVMSWRLT